MRSLTPLLLPLSAIALACAVLPACKSEGYYAMADLAGSDRAAVSTKRIAQTHDALAVVRGAFDDAPVLMENLLKAKDAGWKLAADRAGKAAPRCEEALNALDDATGKLESIVASTANEWQMNGGSPLDPKAKELAKGRADQLRASGLAAVVALRAVSHDLRPAVVDLREVTRFAANHQTSGGADEIRSTARKAADGCEDAGALVNKAKDKLMALEKELVAGVGGK